MYGIIVILAVLKIPTW